MSARRNRPRYRRHGNPFNVRGALAPPDWPRIYGREAPMALDVGFGAGELLLELARRHRHWNVLGIEIRDHLVERVQRRAEAESLDNVHAMVANANCHLAELVPDHSLILVSLAFPDPWYKKRHHKRRVITPAWLDILEPKLLPGGFLHVMSDYEPIAREILDTLIHHPGFDSPSGDGFLESSSLGIHSEREIWHLEQGDSIYRLAYRSIPR